MRMSGAIIGASILLAAVVATAVGVVYSKHQSRRLFVELQQRVAERDRLEVEWGRLQLEQGTWATHGRVERIARERLHMHIPRPTDIVMVGP